MSKVLKAHLAVIVVNLIYGANFSIAKLLMPSYIQPFGFILIRVLVSLGLFFIISPFFTKEKLQRKDIGIFVLCGLFGVAINQLMFFKGLSLTHSINAAIIMTSNPILVIIIALILVKERITVYKSIGIGLGATGALLLLFMQGREISFQSDTFLGDFCIFINAMSYGVFLVISKPLLKRYHPLTVVKWTFLFGSLFVIPFGWTEFTLIPWGEFDLSLWVSLAYVVIGTTFFAYLLNSIALQSLSSSVVSIYIYLQPLFVSLLALLTHDHSITLLHVISSLMIFAGVYLVSVQPKTKEANE